MGMDFRDVMMKADADCVTPVTIHVRCISHATGMGMDFRDVMLKADADCVTPVTLKYKINVIVT